MVTLWNNGLDIKAMLAKGYITKANVARRLKWLATGLCDLNSLHSNYRLHADIKCENFIVNTASDVMKLIDFGCALTVDDKEVVKDVAGSPYYVAPEVLQSGKLERSEQFDEASRATP